MGLAKAHIEWVKSQVKTDNGTASENKDYSAASNTGDRSAASNTGYCSIAVAWGAKSKAERSDDSSKQKKQNDKDDKPEVVELDEDSELAWRVEGLYENKRYKVIMEYLRETIGNEEIKFHDGITAKMDGGDAKKIARDAYHKGSGLRRTAELSVVQQLIENARYKKTVARDHDKFSSCRYYAVTTRYKGVEDRLLLNVGKNKFTGAYHFHAITHDEEK